MSAELRIWSETKKKFYTKKMVLVDIGKGEGIKKENISRPTGIKDINDNEVYENDLARSMTDGGKYLIVMENGKFFAWELPNKTKPELFFWEIEHKKAHIKNGAVIFNAYENKELILGWIDNVQRRQKV